MVAPRLKPSDVRKRAARVPNCYEIGATNDERDHENDDDQHLHQHADADHESDTSSLGDDDNEDDTNAFQVLSFLVENKSDPNQTARINVYYQTGTVAICRLLNGQVRQIFRRRCNLNTVERLLRDPPDLVEISADIVDTNPAFDQLGGGPIDIQRRKDVELADTALAIFAGESEGLKKHIAELQEAHERAASEAEERSSKLQAKEDGKEDDNIGAYEDHDDDDSVSSRREYEFNLPQATVTSMEQFLEDGVSDPLRCVAINGMGTALIYRSGEWAYTSEGLSEELTETLQSIADSEDSSPPRYIALGTQGRYFLAFANGKAIWNGPHSLGKALTADLPLDKKDHGVGRRHHLVSSVAFGSTKDSFFVVYLDGSWEYAGREMPLGLEQLLKDRNSRSDLKTVTLGPGGEWFLKARNGKMWWGGTSRDFDGLMEALEDDGRTPIFVDFGEYGSFFVTHE